MPRRAETCLRTAALTGSILSAHLAGDRQASDPEGGLLCEIGVARHARSRISAIAVLWLDTRIRGRGFWIGAADLVSGLDLCP